MTYAPSVMNIQISIDISSGIVENVKKFGKQYCVLSAQLKFLNHMLYVYQISIILKLMVHA